MSVTTLEPITIEHLDWQECCQNELCSSHPPATHVAIWNFRCTCQPTLVCEPCSETARYTNEHRPGTNAWRCGYCGEAVLYSQVDELVTVRPLS